jgi:serine/threonine-protein kinase HipA
MAFNAAVGNVDDHLKNFWMLASPSGYQLAPAFDLVPDTSGRGEHTLAFEHGFTCPTRETLLAIADAWSVPDPAEILDQITEAVAGFAATARKLEVRAGKSLDTVTADVRKRVKRIAG